MQANTNIATLSSDQAIPLLPNERLRRLTRIAWEDWYGQIPVPSLWITAHVHFKKDQFGTPTPTELADSIRLGSIEGIANAYRVFLQKLITPLNRKLLKSRSADCCFHFRGSIEKNLNGASGKDYHYHFALWAPDNLFETNPTLMKTTAAAFEGIWRQRVNDKESEHYKPIRIDVLETPSDAQRAGRYENKSNSFRTSHEIFDDWSTSRQH